MGEKPGSDDVASRDEVMVEDILRGSDPRSRGKKKCSALGSNFDILGLWGISVEQFTIPVCCNHVEPIEELKQLSIESFQCFLLAR